MIIGLCGKAGSGKGTVASYLESRHGFHIVSFAQPLRSMLISGLGLHPDEFAPGQKEKIIDWLGKSPRELMQTLGTDWGRQMVHQEIWTRIALRRISWLQDSGFDVVIDDMRFDNEAHALLDVDAYLVRIVRPGVASVASHVSEHGISIPEDLFHCLRNDGTVHQLHEQVDHMLGQLMPGAML